MYHSLIKDTHISKCKGKQNFRIKKQPDKTNPLKNNSQISYERSKIKINSNRGKE